MPDRPRRTRATRRREEGAVAVEFALVLPILVMLLLGITTAGLSYSHAIGVTNAVREGARFGATTDASAPATWSSDVISRLRATQFDDPTSDTEVCVQLWKKGFGSLGGSCNGSVPGVDLPASETDPPAVPSGLPADACVVRVIAGRPFSINIGVTHWERVSISNAVARYERMDVVTTCL